MIRNLNLNISVESQATHFTNWNISLDNYSVNTAKRGGFLNWIAFTGKLYEARFCSLLIKICRMKSPILKCIVLVPLIFKVFTSETTGQILKCNNGTASFYSSAPIENIVANSTALSSALNIKTGEIAFAIPIRSFQFRKKLMQTHFNEKYLESDLYPKRLIKEKLKRISTGKRMVLIKLMLRGP